MRTKAELALIYQQAIPATTAQLETVIKDCYPCIKEQIEAMTMQVMNGAKARGCKEIGPQGAREIVLKLIAATGGAVLE